MVTSHSSVATAVARWCNGAGLLCPIFASILTVLLILLGNQFGSNGRMVRSWG